ncbi:single-stranded DNA-binding protein [Aeromicrobium sp. UC242_57]|uniref:single-stranded DNA-binding protein n=1 Tax=Aeromicrobium sp. UC242_57 TaxID=3374624 RepID=UPI00378F0F50
MTMPLTPGEGHRHVMAHHNKVELVGRVSAVPESKALPSGDVVVSFRLVVRRGPHALRRSRQVVDTIDCTVWNTKLQQRVLRWEAGSEVAVTGALRRRFSGSGGGVVSFVSVEVLSCRKESSSAVASSP